MTKAACPTCRMTIPASHLLTAKEAAAYLRRSRSWLTPHAEEIGVVRMDGRLLFRLADLERFVARHHAPPVGVKPEPAPRKPARPSMLPTGMNPVTRRPFGSVAAS
jgi:hypothetical protein